MNDSEIILLNSDGSAVRRREDSLTKVDLVNTEYMMIDTSTSKKEISRNFILVKPTSLLFEFDYAVIDYQILATAVTVDPEEYGDAELQPIHVETSSISDVIRLINCTDRLSCINELIIENETCGENIHIEMGYFGVILYNKERKEIYNKYYSRKDSERGVYYADKVTKVFKDIYSIRCLSEIARKKEFLFIASDMKWSIGEMNKNCNMIGVPLIMSNTVTLCTEDELRNVCRYYYASFVYTVHEDNKDTRKQIASAFKRADYNVVEEISMILEYFLVAYGTYHLTGYNTFLHLDIISHLDFILTMTNMIFGEVYQNQNETGFNSDIDSIIEIELTYKENREKTIYLNHESMISLYDFLQIL